MTISRPSASAAAAASGNSSVTSTSLRSLWLRCATTIDTTPNANKKTTPAAAPAPAAAANDDNGGGGNALPVLVTWNGVANTEASLDVVLESGQIIGPCIAVDILRDEFQRGISDGLGYLFTGNCISAGQSPNPADIRAFRICSAYNNDWANATCTEGAPWNHTNAVYHIDN